MCDYNRFIVRQDRQRGDDTSCTRVLSCCCIAVAICIVCARVIYSTRVLRQPRCTSIHSGVVRGPRQGRGDQKPVGPPPQDIIS